MEQTNISTYLQAATKQTNDFNQSALSEQIGVKQALILWMCDNSKEVFINCLDDNFTAYSFTKREGFVPGRITTDADSRTIIIATPDKCRAFPTSSITNNDGIITAHARKNKRQSDDVEGYTDGRLCAMLYFSSATGMSYTTNLYLIQLPLMNLDAREELRKALFSDSEDSTKLLVNHKNNDSRSTELDNLEYVTAELNAIHGKYIELLRVLDNSDDYIAGSFYKKKKARGEDKGRMVYILKFKLSAYDVKHAMNASLDELRKIYNF